LVEQAFCWWSCWSWAPLELVVTCSLHALPYGLSQCGVWAHLQCLHPRNLLLLRVVCRCCHVFESFSCAFMCACAASTLCWRSFVAGEVLSLPVMPWMALMQSANARITLSVCVMERLVMSLCWNCTVSDRHLLCNSVWVV
jgi:hypothetical protein